MNEYQADAYSLHQTTCHIIFVQNLIQLFTKSPTFCHYCNIIEILLSRRHNEIQYDFCSDFN